MSFVYEGGTFSGTKHAMRGDSGGRAVVSIGQAVHDLFQATLNVSAIAASTSYVLVDLSDATNFPHTDTTNVWLKKLIIDGEKDSDSEYDIKVGVVTEVDASDGSVDWIYVAHLEHTDNPTDSTDRFYKDPDWCQGGDPRGLNCTVSGSATTYIVTNITDSGDTGWQTDTGLTSPAGSSAPGAGDLVVRVESQAAGTGTIDATIIALYDTE